jgi:two-component system response regulator QseB
LAKADRPLILIVEDDPEISRILQFALGENGYRISIARDGDHAMGECLTEDPALILLDLHLPMVNGAEFLRRYRAGGFGHAKVVALSGVGRGDPLAAQVEVDEFVGKPFDIDQVARIVRRLLESADTA